jgi:hypothetical protein
MANRLWAGGDTELWYSDDGGSTWTEVTGLPGRIEGLWGPRNLAPKVYTVVDALGLYTWEEGVGWTLEHADVNASGRFSWPTGYMTQIWCADGDSKVYTNGIGTAYGTHNQIWTRQGAPGAAWILGYGGANDIVDVHGNPDGSAVFALEKGFGFVSYRILQDVGGGTFNPVHTFPIGSESIFQIRTVSPTEVRLFGSGGTTVKVWLWNGATLVLEYTFDVSTLGGTLAAWAGAWSSADGQDCGIAVDTSGTPQGIYLRRTAGVWALDDGDIQSARIMTMSAGIQNAVDDRLLFTQGRFQRRSGGLWVDGGWEPIDTWTDNPPNGYDLWWQELTGGGGPGVSPGVIGEDGGYELELTGSFPAGASLEVFLGSAGDETDSPCYGGPGLGYNPVSLDGTTVTVISPPIAPGAGYSLSWRQVGGGSPTVLGTVTALERNWPSKEFLMRGNFPPWSGIGSRTLEREPLREP